MGVGASQPGPTTATVQMPDHSGAAGHPRHSPIQFDGGQTYNMFYAEAVAKIREMFAGGKHEREIRSAVDDLV